MKSIYYKQERSWTCGAASMRIVLSNLGINKSENEIIRLLKTNKVRGTWSRNFALLANKLKLKYISGNANSINDLRPLLKKGFMVIVCYYIPKDKVDHYSVINKIGKKNVYFLDPWYGADYALSIRYFDSVWKSDNRWENQKKWFIALK